MSDPTRGQARDRPRPPHPLTRTRLCPNPFRRPTPEMVDVTVPVTLTPSAMDVRPCRTFSSPSSRSRRIPSRTATSAIWSAGARSSTSLRMSSLTTITS